MDEIQIAKSKAEILDKLRNSSNNYPFNPDGRVLAKLGGEDVDWARISGLTAELALSRARATNRDFRTVWEETELRVMVELARILEPTLDPVLRGTKEAVEEEGGDVCGVCQESMEIGDEVRTMGCMHRYHVFCIFKWLKQKNVCPLCRYSGVADDQ